LIISRFLVQ